MTLSTQALSALLERHGFDCAVIADREGVSLQRVGRYEDEDCISALNRDFFDPSTVKALGCALQGKILPQISARGECWALTGFAPGNAIIAMYGRSPGNVRVQYFRSKEVWRELESLWSEGAPAV